MSEKTETTSNATNVSIEDTTVSGGKIWKPEETSVASGTGVSNVSKEDPALKWIVVCVTIAFFLISLKIFLDHSETPSSAPSTMTSAKLYGTEGFEIFMAVVILFFGCTASAWVVVPLRISELGKILIMLVSVFLLMMPSFNSISLVNEKEVELWAAEQYGYEVSYDNLRKYNKPIPAVEIETGEKVTIYTDYVDEELVLKEYTDASATRAYDDLTPIEKEGMDGMFLDKETGKKYIVERVDGEMVLTPYGEREADGEQ